MLKRAGRSPIVQKLIGNGLAAYLKTVRATSTLVLDPPDFGERVLPDLPAIVTMWHGQHFLVPFARPETHDVRVMISKSADGEINAIAARKLGMGIVRASGAHRAHQIAKRGGARGFIELLRVLKQGASASMTADVPKVGRVVGSGIIQLARYSGRPIMPLAMTTSRRIDLSTWDRATINLPFSRMALSLGELVHVPRDADEAAMEEARQALQRSLDRATERARALADGKPLPGALETAPS
uniref:lysophospholipid acyltransferase family protein n=1 Tax=Stappia sp. TaxID=1870903 RepID=UPI003BA9640F